MSDVAVVGLACELPGAKTPNEYWENILAVRRAFRRLPAVRMNKDYFSEDETDPDRTYLTRAAVMEGYAFDRVKFRISKATYEQTDLTHWLAVDVTSRALEDAGFAGGQGLPKDRTGAVIGNSLAGEFSRANIMRLRWPYVRRVIDAGMKNGGYSLEARESLLAELQGLYKAPFPAPDADMLAGGLSNTIAGRITNYFDFGGGCYTVDGACSSSLLSIVEGCRALEEKMWDVAIVGGVDLSIDPFEIVGFTRNGALAKTDMRAFDTRSEGFWPGEGCGIAVLMRKSDAVSRGLPIYSVIRGWGISSDGMGGITRPKAEKQTLAMRRCYEMAGYPMSDLAYVEGHGTGTRVGDETELQAVITALTEAGPPADGVVPTIGSVKELIGHTKAAAGISGFMKACFAVQRGIIPSGRATDSPHASLKENRNVLKLAQRPEIWRRDRPMRAGVSGMGFGGINVHVTLEEPKPSANRRRDFSAREQTVIRSQRDVEIIPFLVRTPEQLLARLREVRTQVADLSFGELSDLSSQLCKARGHGNMRLCFVARDAVQLDQQIESVIKTLEEGREPVTSVSDGVFFDGGQTPRKVGLLFPGQGAPSHRQAGMAEFLAGPCNDLYETIPWERDPEGTNTSVAQPAIMASSLAGLRVLERLNLQATVAIGHSLGEIAALVWGQCLSEADAMKLAAERGRIMAEHARPNGGMLALRCSTEEALPLLESTSCRIACFNGASDVCLAGDRDELAAVQRAADDQEITAVPLRVSHAFHSPHMEPALPPFRAVLEKLTLRPPRHCVVSTTAGRALTAQDDLFAVLASQLMKPVLFHQAVQAADVDLWIEVGPGESLRRTMRGVATPVLSMEVGAASVEGTLKAVAAAYVMGAVETLEILGDQRLARDLDLARPRLFLKSQCEMVAESDAREVVVAKVAQPAAAAATATGQAADSQAVDSSVAGFTETLRRLVSTAADIPLEAVSPNDRVLSDLHLNSLVIRELLVKVGKIFAPGDRQFARASMKAFRDSRLSELAEHLFEVAKSSAPSAVENRSPALKVDELPAWVNVFASDTEAMRPAQPVHKAGAANSWTAFSDADSLAAEVQAAMNKDGLAVGRGVVVVARKNAGAEGVRAFLAGARVARESDGVETFLLIQLGGHESSDSLAPAMRTFSLEQPSKRCVVVHLAAWSEGAVTAVKTEVSLCKRYQETVIGLGGGRSRPVLKPLFLEQGRAEPRLNRTDVVLVPGGGKGITFESARRIAVYSGAKLGLFGRATPEDDAALRQNLDALVSAGIDHCYVRADVTDSASVAEAIAEIERALGPTTVVLYGAGTNSPALMHEQTVERWTKTRLVKVEGLKNVLAALPDRPLKGLITFGSIIAQSGMDGECDYALANEELARLTVAHGEAHPDALALCLEWSVWSGAGMGENLGIIDRLKASGVSPISIEQGLDVLENALENELPLPRRLTVCSRYGAMPTVSIARGAQRAPFRFNEKTISEFPGIELVSEATLSVASDPYLDEHIYRGQRVLPAVMAFEAMAQHATAIVPDAGRITIAGAVFQSPVIVPKDGAVRIHVAAARIGERRFIATLRSETSDFAVDCFRCEILVDKAQSEETLPTLGHENPGPDVAVMDMDINRDFYDAVLFHTGGFRTIARLSSVHQNESRGVIELPEPRAWFGPSFPQRLVLGSPGLNDAAAHCHQGSVPQYSLLPAAVERVTFARAPKTGKFAIRTQERSISREHVTIDVEIVDEGGGLVQRWDSLTFRRVDGSDFDGPWPLALLNVYIEHAVENFLGKGGFRSCLERDQNVGSLHLRSPEGQVMGGVFPLRSDNGAHTLDSADDWRRLFKEVGETEKILDRSAAMALFLDETLGQVAGVESRDDGWKATSRSDSPRTTIARVFKLNTGESALGVFTSV